MSKPRNFNAVSWAYVAVINCNVGKMACEDLPACLSILFAAYDDIDCKTLTDLKHYADIVGSDYEECFRRNIKLFSAIADEIGEKEERKRKRDLRRLAE